MESTYSQFESTKGNNGMEYAKLDNQNGAGTLKDKVRPPENFYSVPA